MTRMTEQEWAGVQETLVRGGLRDYIDSILSAHATDVPVPVPVGSANRQILEAAWDDGERTLTLEVHEDPQWFIGRWDGDYVCEGIQHDGILYTMVPQSGGGLVSVIVGRGLVENDAGTIFHSMAEAKAYIQGRIAT